MFFLHIDLQERGIGLLVVSDGKGIGILVDARGREQSHRIMECKEKNL